MLINWKERFKNKVFVAAFFALIIAIIYKALDMLGIIPPIPMKDVLDFLDMILTALGMLGVVVDPTTPGVNDSSRALTYGTDYDIRLTEEAAETEET